MLAGLEDVTLNGESVTALAMRSQLALSREQDEMAEEWGELLAYIRGLMDAEEERQGVAHSWMKMADIFKMVNRTTSATPPTFPEVLQVAMAANTETGRVKAWTRHFHSVKEAPMVWGNRAFRILVAKDSKKPRPLPSRRNRGLGFHRELTCLKPQDDLQRWGSSCVQVPKCPKFPKFSYRSAPLLNSVCRYQNMGDMGHMGPIRFHRILTASSMDEIARNPALRHQ